MDRKLIFLDIDGTILAHGEEVHPAVLEGLRRARNKGHMVFISTGGLMAVYLLRSLIWRQMV